MTNEEHVSIPLSDLTKGRPFYRQVFFEEIYRHIPKDADPVVRVQIGEVAPGQYTDWHLHNGASFFLVLQGRVVMEDETGKTEYKAGDVFAEPIGLPHRAFNPSKTQPLTAVGFFITPSDRAPLVSISPPPDFIAKADT